MIVADFRLTLVIWKQNSGRRSSLLPIPEPQLRSFAWLSSADVDLSSAGRIKMPSEVVTEGSCPNASLHHLSGAGGEPGWAPVGVYLS